MPRDQTSAYITLAKNLNRAQLLYDVFATGSLKLSEERRGRGKPASQENELLRAVVIFAIAALDAYLSDVAAEVLVTQLEKARTPTPEGRALLKRILAEIDTLPFELALTNDAAERRTLAEQAITDHLANRTSTLGAKGVANTLTRIGATVDWDKVKLSPKSKLRSSPSQTVAAVLERWTTARHQLVHQGKAIKVSADQARELIEFVWAIVNYVDAEAVAAMK